MLFGNLKCKIIYKGLMFFPVAIALKALNNLIKNLNSMKLPKIICKIFSFDLVKLNKF